MKFIDLIGIESQKIQKIEYSIEKKELLLLLSDELSFETKEILIDSLRGYGKLEFKLIKNNLNPLSDWNHLVDISYPKHSMLRSFLYNCSRRIHENEIVIDVFDDILYEKLSKLTENKFNFEKACSNDGNNYHIKFHLSHIDPTDVEEITIKFEEPAPKIIETIKEEGLFQYKKKIIKEITEISNVKGEGTFALRGVLLDLEFKDVKDGKTIMTFSLTDYKDTAFVKMFLTKKDSPILKEKLNQGGYYLVEGTNRYDGFENEFVIFATNINELDKNPFIRIDDNEVKRVELHLHTNMSELDAINPVSEIIRKASKMGHKAIAITDHGVLQAFPDAMEAGKKHKMKIIYGIEAYMFDDEIEPYMTTDYSLNDEFIVFDLETTGLSPVEDKIIEIGAVKIRNNEIIDSFSQLINPLVPLKKEIVELTGINDEMLMDKPYTKEVMDRFLEFIGDTPLIAHNSTFDISFIDYYFRQNGINIKNRSIDTLKLSKFLLNDLKRFNLAALCKYFSISLENHHRAVDDCTATAKIYFNLLKELNKNEVFTFNELMDFYRNSLSLKGKEVYHVIILVKNLVGLKSLYELVSHSNINTFYSKPLMPKSMILSRKDNLIIGSACESGELFKGILNGYSDDKLLSIGEFYDYFEIQPLGNNMHLLKKQLESIESIKDINRKIYELGQVSNKLVVATSDVHFFEPYEEINRRIILANKFKDANDPLPLYYRTTKEMLKEFEYFDENIAKEVVITNPNKISEMIEEIIPIPNGTYPPIIKGSDEDLRNLCMSKAHSIYGENLPQMVSKRLERELTSIIDNGYAVMYMIAHKLVKKSLEDGYLVGSRGSVGSSFAATMSDITEVNPLKAHYICSICKYTEFMDDNYTGSGVDLPDKNCPVCSMKLNKEGHDIPFETFLGFEGDKEPDIDLNFAGVYQATSHKYTEELFGKGYVYKAGTIGTLADKSAFGYVKKYFEEYNMIANKYQINRLAKGCTGIRRTTGQHPGGIMVVPDYKDVHDFTPIQYPANDKESGVITTHFDYHSISGRILKLDILGHDVPTIIKQLETFTGVDVTKIPLDDIDTLKIFTSVESLKILDNDYPEKDGSFGIPEFGTKFVRGMLNDTQPTTFTELVMISGLSHGTNVWMNNAHTLVKEKTATLKDVISTRDDIMLYLIKNGLPSKESFNIMERVRKGKKLSPENEELMVKYKIPKWYIDSCNKIEYMFPKAHAVAYVTMSFRIAYFKVHYPLAFYATYFSTKVDSFDAQLITLGKHVVKEKIIEFKQNENNLSNKDQDLMGILELCYEMNSRGYEFLKVDLYESHFDEFLLKDGKILPPLRSLQGVGETAAKSIFYSAKEGPFSSKEEFKLRTKASKVVVEALEKHGSLKGIPDSNQLDFFSLQNF
jgi:DNA polymerase-3 subunit alpha (Gram-positive type)